MKNVDFTEKNITETVTIYREEYDKLIAKNAEMSKQIKWLMERLKLNNKKMFSSSFKKSEEEDTQLSIFNEAEVTSDIKLSEPQMEDCLPNYIQDVQFYVILFYKYLHNLNSKM